MKNEKQVNNERRALIKGLATVAVTGAVIAGTSSTVNAQDITSENSDDKHEGYRETKHIRDYYDTL